MRLEHLLSGARRRKAGRWEHREDREDRPQRAVLTTGASKKESLAKKNCDRLTSGSFEKKCYRKCAGVLEARKNQDLYGGLAQLARAPALHAGGHRFESDILHQKNNGEVIDMMDKQIGIHK